MKTKKTIIAILAIVTLGISAVLIIKGLNPAPLIGASLLIIFLIYALFDMPDKHKNYTYEDQRKGMLNSLGGNPPPEVPKPMEFEEKN